MRPQALKLLSIATLAAFLATGATADRRRGPSTNPGPAQSASGEMGTPFCSSSLNSSGFAAEITAHGSQSLSENNLRLIVRGVPEHEFFAMVHGPTTTAVPFGNGMLCVSGHTVIARPRISPAETVELPVNVNAAMIPPGTVHFQCWFRDHPAGRVQYNTSNGVSVQFMP